MRVETERGLVVEISSGLEGFIHVTLLLDCIFVDLIPLHLLDFSGV